MNAKQIVAELVETKRPCAWCQPQGQVEQSSLEAITHGFCKRHFIEYMRESGMSDADLGATLAKLNADVFCPDLNSEPRV